MAENKNQDGSDLAEAVFKTVEPITTKIAEVNGHILLITGVLLIVFLIAVAAGLYFYKLRLQEQQHSREQNNRRRSDAEKIRVEQLRAVLDQEAKRKEQKNDDDVKKTNTLKTIFFGWIK